MPLLKLLLVIALALVVTPLKWAVRLVVIALLTLAILLLTTPPSLLTPLVAQGLDLAVAQLNGALQYRTVRTTLNGLEINGLRYADPAVVVEVDAAALRWSWLGLLRLELGVNALTATGVTVRLRDAPPSPPSAPFVPPTLALPLTAFLGQVQARDVQVFAPNGDRLVAVDHAQLNATFDGQTVTLADLHARTTAPLEARVQAQGRLALRESWPLTVAAWVQATPPPDVASSLPTQATPVGLMVNLRGDLAALSADVSAHLLASPPQKLLEIAATATNPLDKLTWKVTTTSALGSLTAFAPPDLPPTVSLAALRGELRLRGQGDLANYAAELQLDAAGVPEIATVALVLTANGDAQAVTLSRLRLDTPLGNVDGSARFSFADQQLDAKLTTSPLQWPLPTVAADGRAAAPNPEVALTALTVTAAGRVNDALRVTVATVARAQAVALYDAIRVDGAATVSPTGVSAATVTVNGRDLALNVAGNVRFADLSGALTVRGQGIRLPVEPPITVQQLTLQADGNAQQWQSTLNTEVTGKELPPLKLNTVLAGNDSQATVRELQLDGLDGRLNLTGNANWQNGITWQADLRGNGLNLAKIPPLKEFTSQIGFGLTSRGQVKPPSGNEKLPLLDITVDLAQISGQLRKQPLGGSGQIQLTNQALQLDVRDLRYGNAGAAIRGRLTEVLQGNPAAMQAAVETRLNIPDLRPLLPDARGTVALEAEINGALLTPQFRYTVTAQKLALAAGDTRIAVNQVDGSGQLDLTDRQPSRLSLAAKQIQINDLAWQSVTVTGDGTTARHQLRVAVEGEPVTAALAVRGQYTAAQTAWRGAIVEGRVSQAAAGTWTVAQATALAAQPNRAVLERLCWESAPARLCLAGQWQPTAGAQAEFFLENWPLNRLPVPETVAIANQLGVRGTFRSTPAGQVRGQLDAQVSRGPISVRHEGRTLALPFDGASLRVQVADVQDVQGELQVNGGDLLRVDSQVRWRNGAVTGRIRATGDNFTPFFVLLPPQIVNPQVALRSDLEISGQFPDLQWRGKAALTGLAADIPAGNLRLRDGELALVGQGGELRLTGRVVSGGRIEVDGKLEPLTQRFSATIRGNDFIGWDSKDIQVTIAPDVRLVGDKQQVRVDGRVTIPRAFVAPTELAVGGRVRPSADFRRRPPKNAPTTAANSFGIFAAVEVVLGEVRVSAAGFDGGLSGRLLVEQTPQLPPRATGELQVATGRYVVFGRPLEITQGQVLFSGGPVSNPGLQLEVQQRFGEVSAGARITGTASQPKVTLFSIPAQPDTVTASYLLYGRAPNSRSGQESALLLQLATAAAQTGGVAAANPLAKGLGLEALELGSDDSGGTALTVGKYLTPDLYVGYGVGVFDAINTFMLRYRLTDNLSVRGSSNTNAAGGDITWTIRRE